MKILILLPHYILNDSCVDIVIKMKKVPKLFILVFTVLLFSLPLVTLAQEEDNAGPDGTTDPGTSDVPFDGGVCVLVTFGVGYGIMKMRKDRKTVEFVELS